MKTNRIAVFFSSFRAGGGERVMVLIANALVAHGYDVDVVVLKKVGEYESHVDARARIVVLDAWRILFSLPKLIHYLRTVRPHTMLATDEHTHILLLFARVLSGVPVRVVLRVGNMYSELYARYHSIKKSVMYWLIRHIYRYADVLIANSRGVADDIIALTGIAPDKVTVVHNPKQVQEIHALMQESVEHPWLTNKTFPVVIVVGRLREQKNLPLLLRAFAKVVKKQPARLLLVGDGREVHRLKELVSELSLTDSVSFVGYTHNPFAYMARADVFVTASLWEGMPNTLVEAMICGLPVIASDCPSGPREILAPDTDYRTRLSSGSERAAFGILTAMNDEEALVKEIYAILSDAELAKRYKAAAQQRSGDFDIPGILPKYISVLGV